MESAFRQIGGVHHIPGRDICRPKYSMLHSESKSKNQRQALQAAPVDFSGRNMICGMQNNVLKLHFSPRENKTHDLDSQLPVRLVSGTDREEQELDRRHQCNMWRSILVEGPVDSSITHSMQYAKRITSTHG